MMMRAFCFSSRGQNPVVVRIQQAKDSLPGFSLVIALEGLDHHPGGIGLAQARRQLYLAMIGIVVTDKPADEADHDCGRHGWRRRRSDGLRLPVRTSARTAATSMIEIQIQRVRGQE